MPKRIFSEDEELEVLDFFMKHSNWKTAHTYKCKLKTLSDLLAKFGLTLHEKDENDRLIAKNRKETLVEHLGVDSPVKSAEVLEKIKTTNLKKFGCEWAIASDAAKVKSRATILDKYGVDNVALSREVRQKTEATNLAKYGYRNPMQNKDIQEAAKKTRLDKYGVEYCAQSKEIHDKMNKTYENRYGGVGFASQEIRNKTDWQKYKFNDILFDSSWELAVYIWAIDNNKVVKHEPIRFSYTFDGKEHYYYPDFEIDGQLFEVKNNFLLEKLKTTNTIDNAKYNCMKENNVTIIDEIAIQQYLDYVATKYSKDYLQCFKC